MEKKFGIITCKKAFLVDVDELSVKRLFPDGDGDWFIPGEGIIFASDIVWVDREFSQLEHLHANQINEFTDWHEGEFTDREKTLSIVIDLAEREVEADCLVELDED